jgi:primosomal protein N' (replication factor Y)
MILISCRSKDAVKAESVLQQVHHRIAENLSSRMMLNEPMPSSLSKAKGEFRYQMLVRGEKMTEMTKIIRKALKEFDVNRGVQINCDVNPYQLSQ